MHQAHRTGYRRLRGIPAGIAASGLGQHDRAKHAQQDRHLVTLRALGAAQHVLLGDMGYLVRDHRGDFVLALGGEDQPGIDADVAAQGGEGVDLTVLEHEEIERLAWLVAIRAKVAAHALQPVVQQRVFQQVAVIAQLAQHHAPVFGLPRRGQQLTCRGTDVRKFGVLGRRKGGRQGQSQGSSEQGRAQALTPE